MSQNTNTIYNNLKLSDSAANTATTITESSLNFGSNLQTIPINTTYSNSSITTPAGNIGFGELFFIRDAVGAVAIPIPASNTIFKVVDTVEVADQVNPIGDIHTNYSFNSITSNESLTLTTNNSNNLTLQSANDAKINSVNDITLQSSNQINLNSFDNVNINCGVNLIATCSDNIIMTANNDSISLTADDNITLLSNGLGNINLDAPNINSYTNALPICFDFIEIDRNYNYTSGGQAWELVWTQNLNVPPQFFVDSPQSGYTSTKWKIDFSLNTWSSGNTNNQDRALAYYIDFQDQNANTYSTPIFNRDKPFCYHNNNSTWTQGNPLHQFIPFTWTDIIDFLPISGTGSGNTPLKFNLYISADNPRQFDFNYKLGLTKTNLL